MHNSQDKKYRVACFDVSEHEFVNVSILHKFYDTRVYYRWQLFLEDRSKGSTYINCNQNSDRINAISDFKKCNSNYKLLSLLLILFKIKKDKVILFHDPIIILIVPFIYFMGFRNFVFDSHEDVEKDILIKEYIFKPFRKPISFIYMMFLKTCIFLFGLKVVSPSHAVCRKYSGSLIYNFPSSQILIDNNQIVDYKSNVKSYGYFGTLTKTRSIDLLINIFKQRREKLYLIGSVNDNDIKTLLSSLPENIIYIGDVCLDDAKNYFDLFDVGFCIPILNSISHDALPVKIFEYYYMNKIIISSKINVIAKFNVENIHFTELDPKSIHDTIDKVNKLQLANFNLINKNKYRFESQLCVD